MTTKNKIMKAFSTPSFNKATASRLRAQGHKVRAQRIDAGKKRKP